MSDRHDQETGAKAELLGVTIASPEVTGTLDAPVSGRRVRLRLTLGKETLEIVGPGGATELAIVLTERGPKLIIDCADVQINTVNRIDVACESFEVTARAALSLTGAEARLTASAGDVDVRANDHVRVVGEQIRLNCDGPDRVPAWMQAELAARLAQQDATTAAKPPGPPQELSEPTNPEKNS